MLLVEARDLEPSKRIRWRCRCDCGAVTVVQGANLRNGHTASCGGHRAGVGGRPKIDETDLRYGRLLVIGRELTPDTSAAYWRCLCDCGEYTVVAGGNLRSGRTKSCGCLKSESASSRRTTHGLSGTPIYTTWVSLIQRCLNVNTSNYSRYGGRGITVCDRWHPSNENAFENFLSDMGDRPSSKHSLDRKDNDSEYSPDNCRWATATEQANNRRSNRLFTHNGMTKTLAQWSRELGIKQATIRCRVDRYGWTVAKALGLNEVS